MATERDIQNVVARWCFAHQHLTIVPNAIFFPNEADVLSVTKAHLAHSFEIKISKSDLRADFKKERHQLLENRQARVRNRWSGKQVPVIPSYFWFVAPESVLAGVIIPDYAGVMIPNGHQPRVIRQAPRLHREKLTDAEVAYIANKLLYKYWRARLND